MSEGGSSHYPLKEFTDSHHGLQVSVNCSATPTGLDLLFIVKGDVSHIEIPLQRSPLRMTGLWTNTCFELFGAIPSADSYWEWNLSPSSDWQVFAFKNYREVDEAGSLECAPYQPNILRLSKAADEFVLHFELNLPTLLLQAPVLELNPACVLILKNSAGKVATHWAVRHGEKLDFHRRSVWPNFQRRPG